MNPFDYLNSINFTKENIIEDSDNPELMEKLYAPFLMNKGLSNFIDTIYLANEMNKRSSIDKKLQYDFLINTVRKRKRFGKWHKPLRDENLDVVMSYYDYSYDKASQVVDLLTDDQLNTIRKSMSKGGVSNGGESQ